MAGPCSTGVVNRARGSSKTPADLESLSSGPNNNVKNGKDKPIAKSLSNNGKPGQEGKDVESLTVNKQLTKSKVNSTGGMSSYHIAFKDSDKSDDYALGIADSLIADCPRILGRDRSSDVES